jgi:hypothetical membrane protein
MSTVQSETKAEPRSDSLALKFFLLCGVVGPLLFVFTFLVEGVLRPDYNPWRHFVSSLSQGPLGWVQMLMFIKCGALIVCFSIGLRQVLRPGKGSTWGPILMAIFGLCLIGAGIFVTDPMLGYPPGASEAVTKTGAMHMLLSLIAFAALIADCFVLARRFAADPAWRGWFYYSISTGIVVLVFFILTDVVASTNPLGPAGTYQRISIIAGWVWVSLLAYRLLRLGAPANH